jgi:protocatechuate 3,4-dioxygenase beta subunit
MIPRAQPANGARLEESVVSMDRRIFLGGAGAIVGGTLGGIGLSEAAEVLGDQKPITQKEWEALYRSYGSAQFTCVRASQAVEGPYYFDNSPLRSAVAEGRKGERLRLGITIGGMLSPIASRCFPLAGAVVDIWQTDAAGIYSNVGGDLQTVDTTGQAFLRGHQITDEKGYVEFETIVPGWEVIALPPPAIVGARTNHIHVKVYHGRDVLTAQLYFPDPLLDHLFAEVEPYKSHTRMTAPGLPRFYERVRNDKDGLFLADKSTPMPVERVNGVLTAKATIGMISQGNRGQATLFRGG